MTNDVAGAGGDHPEEHVSEWIPRGETRQGYARFSPGPWWGFNGIRQLVLTDNSLLVLPFRDWMFITPARYELGNIRTVNWEVRTGGLTSRRFTVRLRVKVANRRRVFTGIDMEARSFARDLEAAVDKAHH